MGPIPFEYLALTPVIKPGKRAAMNVYGTVVSMDHVLGLTLLAPFVGAFLCALTRDRARNVLAVLFSGLTFVLALGLALFALDDVSVAVYPRGAANLVFLSADALSLLMAVVVSGLALLVTLYAAGYTPVWGLGPAKSEGSDEEANEDSEAEAETGTENHQDWLMLAVAGALGIFLAGNYLTMFIAFLITAFTAWRLSLMVLTPESARAARIFSLAALGATLTWLAGLLVMYTAPQGSSFLFSDISSLPVVYAEIVTGLFGITALILAAQLPFLGWIVKAAEADIPTNAFIHSGVLVTAGVYLVARMTLANPGLLEWIAPAAAVVGLASMLIAMVMMLFAADIKQGLMLAVATHCGMIISALSVAMWGSDKALAGAALQIVTMASGMALLFMAVGLAIRAGGSRQIADLSGLGSVVPYSALGYFVGAFVIAGIPPLGGFWGKLLVLSAGIATGGFGTLISILILLESLVIFSYFLWLGHTIYFGQAPEKSPETGIGVSARAAVVLLTVASLALPMIALPLLEQITPGM
ncbi:MAG: proton-conducting transporter membrane subunit [Armatimonadota bacterium]